MLLSSDQKLQRNRYFHVFLYIRFVFKAINLSDGDGKHCHYIREKKARLNGFRGVIRLKTPSMQRRSMCQRQRGERSRSRCAGQKAAPMKKRTNIILHRVLIRPASRSGGIAPWGQHPGGWALPPQALGYLCNLRLRLVSYASKLYTSAVRLEADGLAKGTMLSVTA